MNKRRGLRPILKDLREVFEMAREMCGSGDPDSIDQRQAEITALEREVVARLRQKVSAPCD